MSKKDKFVNDINKEIAKIRWHACVVFDENERPSGEINIRMTELFAIVNYKSGGTAKAKTIRYKSAAERARESQVVKDTARRFWASGERQIP